MSMKLQYKDGSDFGPEVLHIPCNLGVCLRGVELGGSLKNDKVLEIPSCYSEHFPEIRKYLDGLGLVEV